MNEFDAKEYVLEHVSLEDITDLCGCCHNRFTKGVCIFVPARGYESSVIPAFYVCPQCELGLAQ